MENKNKIIKKINESWPKVKNKIDVHWHHLTPEHKEIIIDYESLVSQLKLVYHFSDNEIENEIFNFMEKFSLLPIDIYLENLKKILYQSTLEQSDSPDNASKR